MKILFIGDIFGKPGRKILGNALPGLIQRHNIDLVIANAENMAAGRGITAKLSATILQNGVDVMTSGNHVWDQREAIDYIESEPRLLRPANFPLSVPGNGHYIATSSAGHVTGIINIMGRVFMVPLDNPFEIVLKEIEQIRKKTSTRSAETQGLLEPLVITLSPLEERFLNDNWDHFATHGWELEVFGDNNILIRTTPSTIADKNPIQTFHDVLESAITEDLKLDWSERISASMACHSAVTAGMLLPNEEMHEIVRMLETAQQPRTCPHGRPTIIRIGIQELEKEFLRK